MKVKRFIERRPGKGSFFRGRCTTITELWHRPDPPRRIVDVIGWMKTVELGMAWLQTYCKDQKARMN